MAKRITPNSRDLVAETIQAGIERDDTQRKAASAMLGALEKGQSSASAFNAIKSLLAESSDHGLVVPRALLIEVCQQHDLLRAESVKAHLTSQREHTATSELDVALAALHEAREFINDHVDVLDGDYGEPRPNRAMRLLPEIDTAIAKVEGK